VQPSHGLAMNRERPSRSCSAARGACCARRAMRHSSMTQRGRHEAARRHRSVRQCCSRVCACSAACSCITSQARRMAAWRACHALGLNWATNGVIGGRMATVPAPCKPSHAHPHCCLHGMQRACERTHILQPRGSVVLNVACLRLCNTGDVAFPCTRCRRPAAAGQRAAVCAAYGAG
jgi:hypothetical protein